jgi:hypothetical protein
MKYVYLIYCEGNSLFKIGVSKNPKSRLKQLQTGSGLKLSLLQSYPSVYAHKIESSFHNRYSYLKTSGEWFNLPYTFKNKFLTECKRSNKIFECLNDETFYF